MSSCCCQNISLAPVLAVLGEMLDQLVILNAGLGFTPGASAAQLTPLPVTILDGATVGGSSDYNLGLTDTHNKKFIQVLNLTDGPVFVSLDNGSTDFTEVTSGGSETLQLGSLQAFHAGNVLVRRDESNILTLGSILITAFY